MAKKYNFPYAEYREYPLAQGVLTKKSVSYFFEYVDGNFVHKVRYGVKISIGKQVGTISKDGYLQVSIFGKKYYVHRLIYVYNNGEIPRNMVIDHKDQDKLNNNISNLRCITHGQNGQNWNPKGYTYTRGKYWARITVNKKKISLGRFETKQEASDAYYAAKKIHHISQVNRHFQGD